MLAGIVSSGRFLIREQGAPGRHRWSGAEEISHCDVEKRFAAVTPE